MLRKKLPMTTVLVLVTSTKSSIFLAEPNDKKLGFLNACHSGKCAPNYFPIFYLFSIRDSLTIYLLLVQLIISAVKIFANFFFPGQNAKSFLNIDFSDFFLRFD